MSDHEEIERTIHNYGYVIDGKEWHRLDELFVEDGAFVVEGTPIDVRGLPAIEKFMRSFPVQPLAHFTTNIVIDIDDDGQHARARSTVFGPLADGTATIGRYADRLVRTAHGWRIERRAVVVIEQKWRPRTVV